MPAVTLTEGGTTLSDYPPMSGIQGWRGCPPWSLLLLPGLGSAGGVGGCVWGRCKPAVLELEPKWFEPSCLEPKMP